MAKAVTAVAEPLLSPELLARLERLEFVSRKVFRGRMKGERRSPRKGQSVEFADFRNYVPGDDLRMIDWNLYARLDQLFLKLFMEEEDLHVDVLIDGSGSMDFGTPTKFRTACQLGAAIGYVGMCRGDRVTVAAMGPHAAAAPVGRGRAGLPRMTSYLESIRPVHDVPLHDAVRDFLARRRGAGVCVLISDLMDKAGFETALRMLTGRRLDVFLVHILAPEEYDPPVRGDRRLIDAEDGDRVEITVNTVVLQRYRENVRRFIESVRGFCSRRDIVYLPVRSDTPVDDVMTRYLRRRGVVR